MTFKLINLSLFSSCIAKGLAMCRLGGGGGGVSLVPKKCYFEPYF